MQIEDIFKRNKLTYQHVDISGILLFDSLSERVKNYLKCMGKTIKLHKTEHGGVLTTLYSVREIMDSQEVICSEEGLLVIGNGLNGDLLTVNLKNYCVGYIFHDDLWEENYDCIEDIYCESPFEIEDFIKVAVEDDNYPVDGTMAEENMTKVRFYDKVEDSLLHFAVIIARSGNKWVFCKHRKRDTYEVPGGHREPGENIDDTARRELYEETGAVSYTMQPICVYSVTAPDNFDGQESFGMLYYAQIEAFEPELHSEIEKIILTEELPERWTYPEIQPKLLEEAERRGII